jgi:hypothetical protein
MRASAGSNRNDVQEVRRGARGQGKDRCAIFAMPQGEGAIMSERRANWSSYSKEFQSVLLSVVGGALSLDEFIAATEFCALYAPAEVINAASAAEDSGLPVDEGVGYFLLCICAEANQDRGWPAAEPVALPTPEANSKLSVIIDYAIPILLGEKGLNQDLAAGFTQTYVHLHRKQH